MKVNTITPKPHVDLPWRFVVLWITMVLDPYGKIRWPRSGGVGQVVSGCVRRVLGIGRVTGRDASI